MYYLDQTESSYWWQLDVGFQWYVTRKTEVTFLHPQSHHPSLWQHHLATRFLGNSQYHLHNLGAQSKIKKQIPLFKNYRLQDGVPRALNQERAALEEGSLQVARPDSRLQVSSLKTIPHVSCLCSHSSMTMHLE